MKVVPIRASAFVAPIAFLFALPLSAQADSESHARYVAAVDRMMTELAPQSAQAAFVIREAYRPYLDALVLNEYRQIRGALSNGGLVPLPPDSRRFNVTPRLDGANPIGEKDLGNQASYLSARPATIGCLLDVASRVKSGPVEVTSLVRHGGYQDALRMTNSNATASVPIHTMGLAFDIAIVNTPLETVYEIRDVLRQMSDAGDILFIGEHRQLVFHVVPHPSRLGHFTELYARALGSRLPLDIAVDSTRPVTASVTTEVVALQPTAEFAAEWWAARNVPVDFAIEVTPELVGDRAFSSDQPMRSVVGEYLGMLGNLLISTWDIVTSWTSV